MRKLKKTNLRQNVSTGGTGEHGVFVFFAIYPIGTSTLSTHDPIESHVTQKEFHAIDISLRR